MRGSRADRPAQGANRLPTSVPEIGRALEAAREEAGLTLDEAAARAGLDAATVGAVEAATVSAAHDRIDTLRAMRTYAYSLGLPGDDYVLVAVEHWPASAPGRVNDNTAVVPVVSVTGAPPGGHSPAGGWGAPWTAAGTSVTDTALTGAMDSAVPLSVHDTGVVRVTDTGEVRAVGLPAPRSLKASVYVTAFLVLLGGLALIAHTRFDNWANSGSANVSHWFDNAKSALGLSSKPAGHTATPPSTTTPAHRGQGHAGGQGHSGGQGHAGGQGPKVTEQTDPSGQSLTVNVAASSFTVKVAALHAPCWVSATAAGQSKPLYAQVLPANQTEQFTVTSSMTLDTGSSAGRIALYKGKRLIGFYVPTKVPFLMHLNATE